MRSGWVATLAVSLGLAGCGTSNPNLVVTGNPPAHSYPGPMVVSVSHSPDAPVAARSGAAGRALECAGTPYAGGAGYYDSGLASVQDSAEAALKNYFSEEILQLPRSGYRVERSEDGRVLFSYDVDGQSKITFIAADSIRDFNHDRGWGVETWAECDPSELPANVTDELGIQVWQDAHGSRVPVTKIVSFKGAEHCDWQGITFLEIDNNGDHQYVRDVTGELKPFLASTFDADVPLPAEATDTGFSRGGRRLWLDPKRMAAYLVIEREPSHAERWPVAKTHIGCA